MKSNEVDSLLNKKFSLDAENALLRRMVDVMKNCKNCEGFLCGTCKYESNWRLKFSLNEKLKTLDKKIFL